jgi:hypothetical protein
MSNAIVNNGINSFVGSDAEFAGATFGKVAKEISKFSSRQKTAFRKAMLEALVIINVFAAKADSAKSRNAALATQEGISAAVTPVLSDDSHTLHMGSAPTPSRKLPNGPTYRVIDTTKPTNG